MNPEKILIVDDEADIALILKLQLEDAGYSTDRAKDGIEALEFLKRKPYSLMLLDIKMPRMDGLQVLEHVHAEQLDTAVVMMTAHGSEDIAVEAMKKGAIDYIAKPFSTDDLLKRVGRAIEFARTRRENLLLQHQLDEERKKMAAVLQGMPDLLVAVDRRGLVITVNGKVESILHSERRNIIGRHVAEVLIADIPADRLPCMQVLKAGEPCTDFSYTLAVGGHKMPVLASATPLVGGDGSVAGSVEIIRDISKLVALEQEKQDFVSMLSHDLKSPITAIVGSLDLVREGRLGPVNGEQQEYLESAIESCAEMVEMIDTLLDIHKFDAGKMVLAIKAEDPLPLIQRTVSRFRSMARRGEITLTVGVSGELLPIEVDRNKITRVFTNILSNAFKFTPEGGAIEIRADIVEDIAHVKGRIPSATYSSDQLPLTGRFMQISIRDTGVGIPAEAIGTIFDRFVQAKNRRMGKTKGTGLGLAFCRKVMDAHHGYVWVESVEGTGSTFFLLFPLDKEKRLSSMP